MNNCHIDPDSFVTLWQWDRIRVSSIVHTFVLEDLFSCISRKTGLQVLSFWMAYYLPDWVIHFSDQPIFLAHCKFI